MVEEKIKIQLNRTTLLWFKEINRKDKIGRGWEKIER